MDKRCDPTRKEVVTAISQASNFIAGRYTAKLMGVNVVSDVLEPILYDHQRLRDLLDRALVDLDEAGYGETSLSKEIKKVLKESSPY